MAMAGPWAVLAKERCTKPPAVDVRGTIKKQFERSCDPQRVAVDHQGSGTAAVKPGTWSDDDMRSVAGDAGITRVLHMNDYSACGGF